MNTIESEPMDVSEDYDTLKAKVLLLMDHKTNIEKQLSDLKEILDINHIGMTEELIDSEGYPRSDIDVYQVRHARSKIICLQNDHKDVMKKIEKGLEILHSSHREQPTARKATVVNNLEVPIAKVNLIELDSPAFLAGLQVDDLILEFGTVNFKNFNTLQDIARVIQHSVNKNVVIKVKRGPDCLYLNLTPKEWSGKGLLGCNILPIENVDR